MTFLKYRSRVRMSFELCSVSLVLVPLCEAIAESIQAYQVVSSKQEAILAL